MDEAGANIVDWAHFEKARGELGPGFIRILSYFREDGAKSSFAKPSTGPSPCSTKRPIP